MFNVQLSSFISRTGPFGTFALEGFAGRHQLFSFDFGAAQRAVAIFGDLEAIERLITAGGWAGVDRHELALDEPGQRQVHMADHFASRPLVDHLGNAFQGPRSPSKKAAVNT